MVLLMRIVNVCSNTVFVSLLCLMIYICLYYVISEVCSQIQFTYTNFLLYIFIENQQMHQNDHFIVMLSQTLLNVSAYQCHHPGAHRILTKIDVHYRKNNGISSEVAPINIVTLWIQVDNHIHLYP
jgi:hypothetical protein